MDWRAIRKVCSNLMQLSQFKHQCDCNLCDQALVKPSLCIPKPCKVKATCVCRVLSRSVMSDSLWPRGLYPARLLYPWGFSRQEHWSGLPCLPPGDLSDPGTEPTSLASPALQADFFICCAIGVWLFKCSNENLKMSGWASLNFYMHFLELQSLNHLSTQAWLMK